MKIINFEGLGLSLKINSLLLNINGVKIYWYAFIIVISVIIAILLCKKDDGKYHIKFDDILTLLIFLIPISIICARMYFVIFKFKKWWISYIRRNNRCNYYNYAILQKI